MTTPPPKLKDVRLYRFGQPAKGRSGGAEPPAPPPKPEPRPEAARLSSEVVRPQRGLFPKRKAPAETPPGGASETVRVPPGAPATETAPPPAPPPVPVPRVAPAPPDDAAFFATDQAPPGMPRLAGPAPRPRRRGLLLCAAILAAALLAYGAWAYLSPGAGITASGRLVVEPQQQVVQHRDGGYVAQILVAEGDRVAAGDRLIALDASRLAAQADLQRLEVAGLRALVTRLRAEQARRTDLPAEGEADAALAAALAEQRDLLRSRRATLDGQLGALQQRIRQLRAQIEGLAAQGQARSRQIQMLYLQIDGLGRAPAARARLPELERGIARLEGERADTATETARLEQAISEAELQALQLRRDFGEQVEARLQEAGPALAAAQERLVTLEDQLRRLDIRAPVAGIVSGLSVQAPETTILPGQDLLRISAGPDRLFVEVGLRARDVERLSTGGTARLLFAGPPPVPATARLERAATEWTADPATGQPVFPARLAVEAESAARLAGTPLVPGMAVEVRVVP